MDELERVRGYYDCVLQDTAQEQTVKVAAASRRFYNKRKRDSSPVPTHERRLSASPATTPTLKLRIRLSGSYSSPSTPNPSRTPKLGSAPSDSPSLGSVSGTPRRKGQDHFDINEYVMPSSWHHAAPKMEEVHVKQIYTPSARAPAWIPSLTAAEANKMLDGASDSEVEDDSDEVYALRHAPLEEKEKKQR